MKAHTKDANSKEIPHPNTVAIVRLLQLHQLRLDAALEEQLPKGPVEVGHHTGAIHELLPGAKLCPNAMDEFLAKTA